jgi:SRR1
MEDGWTTVSAGSKKRATRTVRTRQGQLVSSSSFQQHLRRDFTKQLSLLSDENRCGDSDTDDLCQCIDKCIDIILQSDLYTNLCELLKQWIDTIGNEIRVGKVVAYGIGNFSNTNKNYHSASLLQLALALCIQRKVHVLKRSVIELLFFDPCSTIEELRFLKERYAINVITVNERGNYNVGHTDTIFFMPHCPPQLYENVVWSNFHNVHRILLIGNSLRNLAERRSPTVPSCLQTLVPYLHESNLIASSTDYKTAAPLGNFLGAWNDTFLSFYNFENHEAMPRPYENINSNYEDLELL